MLSSEILAVLDGAAAAFAFPGFNNANYETVDSRLHLFRSADGRWALVVEELVDWPGAGGPQTILFAFGAIAGESLSTIEPLTIDIEYDPVTDEPLLPTTVAIRGAPLSVDRVRVGVLAAEHRIGPELALLVLLDGAHRDALFATPEELGARVASGLSRILTVDAWAHPDVYGGPKPSASEAFCQLAEVLATGNVARWAPTEAPNNRDWKMWLASH